MDIVIDDGVARIIPVHGPVGRGKRIVESMLGKGDVSLSTDEIMALTRGE